MREKGWEPRLVTAETQNNKPQLREWGSVANEDVSALVSYAETILGADTFDLHESTHAKIQGWPLHDLYVDLHRHIDLPEHQAIAYTLLQALKDKLNSETQDTE